MTYALCRDIPPPVFERKTRNAKYPFKDMQVGDSFFVPTEEVPPKGVSSIRATAYAFKRKHASGAKFTILAVTDGIRVWRTV